MNKNRPYKKRPKIVKILRTYNYPDQYYKRIIINGEIFHSYKYCKCLKRNSLTVELIGGSLFEIEVYVVLELMGEG